MEKENMEWGVPKTSGKCKKCVGFRLGPGMPLRTPWLWPTSRAVGHHCCCWVWDHPHSHEAGPRNPDSGNQPYSCAPVSVSLELLSRLKIRSRIRFSVYGPTPAASQHPEAGARALECHHWEDTLFLLNLPFQWKQPKGATRWPPLHLCFPSLVQRHSVGEFNSHAEKQLQRSLRNVFFFFFAFTRRRLLAYIQPPMEVSISHIMLIFLSEGAQGDLIWLDPLCLVHVSRQIGQ